MSSTCFDPDGSSSVRRLYIQLWYVGTVWYGTVYCVVHAVITIKEAHKTSVCKIFECFKYIDIFNKFKNCIIR